MQSRPYFDVDYCMYSDWGYKKRTRIWTNATQFKPLVCNKKCGNIVVIDNRQLHKKNCGSSSQSRLTKTHTTLKDRYRIPPLLIKSLFAEIV